MRRKRDEEKEGVVLCRLLEGRAGVVWGNEGGGGSVEEGRVEGRGGWMAERRSARETPSPQARRANKEKEKAQRERLKALKDNNMEEYMKLVTDSKNERITQVPPASHKALIAAQYSPPLFTISNTSQYHSPPSITIQHSMD